MITQKLLKEIVMEEVAFVEERFMSAKFRKAIEAHQDLQLKQQKLQKAFVGTKDPKKREKLKQALIKIHPIVKKAEADFNSALHIEPVEFDEGVIESVTINESTGISEMKMTNKQTGEDITKHVLAYMEKKITKKEFEKLTGLKKEKLKVTESDAEYAKSLEKIARDKQLKMLSKKDKETLLKIADLMKKMKEGSINGTDEQKKLFTEKAQGLWANIRAKRARGEKPASKGSKAHDDAVAAGKKINNEADAPKSGLQSKGIDKASMQHLALDYLKATGLLAKIPRKSYQNWTKTLKTSHTSKEAAASLMNLAKASGLISKIGKSTHQKWMKKMLGEGRLTEAKDRTLNKLFQRSKTVTSKSGEDKLYKLSQDWEDWNVDNDDKYDDLVDPLFMAVELVQDAGTPGVNDVTKDKEWYSYMKSADKHLKTFKNNVVKAMKLHKEGVVTEVDSHTHSNCSCTKQENTTPVNEDEGKVKCSKCNGEGCSHCNNTGFHVAEDKLFPRKSSEKKINKDKK
tara:strand:+ start:504 stop:2045 length:1542 start_codon:yes stop_codon:yes gene_type:complete